jgi:glycosyl transferase, family 25
MDIPAFYINLDARQDRREFMERQFAEIGMRVQRIPAVSAGSLPAEMLERHCSPRSVHCLSRSELGCWLSHTKAWRAFLATGASWGLVLEDDAILSIHLPEFISAFLAGEAASSHDLLQLESTARRSRVLPPIGVVGGRSLRPFRSTIHGAAAYLLSARAVRHFLGRPDLFHRQVDCALFTPYAPTGRDLRTVLVEPALCIQANKVEATGLAAGSIAPARLPAASLGVWLSRATVSLKRQIANVVDHVGHLPRGLRSMMIPFDEPERRYVGSKTAAIGTELSE